MKAIRVREFGPPEVMRLEDLPDLKAGPGQIVVRIEAAGVNPVDSYVRTGTLCPKTRLALHSRIRWSRDHRIAWRWREGPGRRGTGLCRRDSDGDLCRASGLRASPRPSTPREGVIRPGGGRRGSVRYGLSGPLSTGQSSARGSGPRPRGFGRCRHCRGSIRPRGGTDRHRDRGNGKGPETRSRTGRPPRPGPSASG